MNVTLSPPHPSNPLPPRPPPPQAGLPYAMDPTSLATRGESRMGGALKGTTFAAHYRITTEVRGAA